MEIQEKVGNSSREYLKYFTMRFPRLMTVLYVFAQKFLQVEDRIWTLYFDPKSDN